jgi:hypothetical protein
MAVKQRSFQDPRKAKFVELQREIAETETRIGELYSIMFDGETLRTAFRPPPKETLLVSTTAFTPTITKYVDWSKEGSFDQVYNSAINGKHSAAYQRLEDEIIIQFG